MPPESFDPSKTDLQSLLRSGTWLYKPLQRTSAHPPDDAPTPFTDASDVNTDLNFETVDFDTIDFQKGSDAEGTFDPFQVLEEFDNNPDPLLQSSPRFNGNGRNGNGSNGHDDTVSRRGTPHRSQWRFLFWVLTLGILLPLGALAGSRWWQGNGIEALAKLGGTSQTRLNDPAPSLMEVAQQNQEVAATLTLTAKTEQEWQTIAQRWQTAMDALKQIDPNSPHYAIAQNRLVDYRSEYNSAIARSNTLKMEAQILKQEKESFRAAVRHAARAADLTQTAQTGLEWKTVILEWETAIDKMKLISAKSPHYPIAQDRIPLYTRNLEYAKRQAGV